jgi:hypothetical protein
MEWLGHHDSAMVRHYYHLRNPEAQAQMSKLDFAGDAGRDGAVRQSPDDVESPPSGEALREVS